MATTTTPTIHAGKRRRKILRLFFSLVVSFAVQYVRARLTGKTYNFFEDSQRNRARAIKIRNAALQMGGVLIKVGQFLSSRVDLLPSEYIEELALLQDEVPGVSFDQIQAVIEVGLGGPLAELFRSIDPEPIAAASLGQVHCAVLPTGQRVVVKAQRPRIKEVVEADLAAIRYIVRWLNKNTPIGRRANLDLILREFEDTLRLELDYIREGHHAERIGWMFADTPTVAVPRIYWSHTALTVLTMQRMSGTKVTDFRELERHGIGRAATAEILMRAYLRQVLEDGFFHADPHPGNILVRPGPVVVLLDFGMVGDIPPAMRRDLRAVFLGIVRRDYDSVLDAMVRLGFISHGSDRRVLKHAISWTVETFYEMSFEELRAVSPQSVLDELQDVFYTESFQIPANFAFLGRALGTLSGLCTALDPSFQFVTVAEPFARQLIQQDAGLGGTARQIAEEARSLLLTAYHLPRLSRNVLSRIDSGELDVQRQLNEMVRGVTRLERAMSRMLYGLLFTGFLATGAFIIPSHYTLFAVGAFLTALIFLVFIFFPLRRMK